MREPDKEHLLMHGFALSRVMRASFSFSFSIYQQTLRRSCSGALCVSVCVFVCLCVCQRFPRVFYSLPHPQHSGLCGQTMPTTNLTPCLFHHNSFIFVFSLSPTLSLYRLFGWSNVQVTFDNYYWNMFCINIIIMLMWGLNLVLSNGWLLVGFTF